MEARDVLLGVHGLIEDVGQAGAVPCRVAKQAPDIVPSVGSFVGGEQGDGFEDADLVREEFLDRAAGEIEPDVGASVEGGKWRGHRVSGGAGGGFASQDPAEECRGLRG